MKALSISRNYFCFLLNASIENRRKTFSYPNVFDKSQNVLFPTLYLGKFRILESSRKRKRLINKELKRTVGNIQIIFNSVVLKRI